MYRIFIVEDDDGIASAISVQLSRWGYDTAVVSDFRNVTGEVSKYSPHLILMDISLPFFDGFHWCGEIRRSSSVPIIFISSAADNMSMIMAINMGADDFIAKPFDMNLLTAKIQALLRRSYDYSESAPKLVYRGAVLSTGDNALIVNGETVDLTKNEYRILLTLFENIGSVVSRDKLMEALWNSDSFVDDNALTVNINRLRKKLDSVGLDSFITTKVGVGYMLAQE